MATDKIVLGSGKLYTAEFTGTIPTNETLEVEANLLGAISGGATIEYKPKFYEAKDDLGQRVKKVITEEEATLKSGIMTFNGKVLAKLCSTATVSEDTTAKTRTVKIGGLGNYDGKSYVIRFVHEDDVDGDIRLTIVGTNEGGFKLEFAKDKATVIDAEFSAEPSDSQGTLIIYEESTAAEA